MTIKSEGNKMKCSVKELAAQLKVDYAVAQGVIKFLESQGQATVVEKRKSASGKGKPSNIYEIPETVTIQFAVSA